MTEGRSAIVLAAGQGTRMKSSLPKVLHPLLGRTLLSHAMHAVMGLDPDNVVVVVRHDRDKVAEEAVRVLHSVVIADQDEIPGTGRAVYCALKGAAEQGCPLTGTVVVNNADVPMLQTDTLEKLVAQHEANGAAVTVVSAVVDDPTGYGRIVRRSTDEDALAAIVEHRDATDQQLRIREINAGIYAFDTEFLLEALESIGSSNDQGEVYLTDTVAVAVSADRIAQGFVLDDSWQAEGCNDRAQLSDLRKEMNARICRAHQIAGVSIVDPLTTSVDVDVDIEPDAVIEPCTQLVGKTTIGLGARVGPGSTIVDSIVGSGAVVPRSYVVSTRIAGDRVLEPYSVVGPSPRFRSEGNER